MHTISQEQVRDLTPGEHIDSGPGLGRVVVLHTGAIHDARSGVYAWRHVITLHTPDGEVGFRPFAVHRAIFQDDTPAWGQGDQPEVVISKAPHLGRWMLEDGDYCRDLPAALRHFEAREGR
jgi:hypothetical protein